MKKAIIFDIDGTAINSPIQKLPTKKLANIIHQLKNKFYFCAATGRVWSFAKPVLKSLHLTDPCIISAGTQICDPETGRILWQKVIEDKSLNQAIEILKRYPKIKILYNDYKDNDYLYGGIFPKDFQTKERVYFLEQIFVSDKIAPEIREKLNKIEGITCVMVVAQRPGCKDLHIINKSATKEHTITKLLKILKVLKKNSIGFGDGYNDIHLFNSVNYKIAVGNAVPEVKKMADKVIGPVKNDGMAKYLETLRVTN